MTFLFGGEIRYDQKFNKRRRIWTEATKRRTDELYSSLCHVVYTFFHDSVVRWRSKQWLWKDIWKITTASSCFAYCSEKIFSLFAILPPALTVIILDAADHTGAVKWAMDQNKSRPATTVKQFITNLNGFVFERNECCFLAALSVLLNVHKIVWETHLSSLKALLDSFVP